MVFNCTNITNHYVLLKSSEYYSLISISFIWIILASALILVLTARLFTRHEYLINQHASLLRDYMRDCLLPAITESAVTSVSGSTTAAVSQPTSTPVTETPARPFLRTIRTPLTDADSLFAAPSYSLSLLRSTPVPTSSTRTYTRSTVSTAEVIPREATNCFFNQRNS